MKVMLKLHQAVNDTRGGQFCGQFWRHMGALWDIEATDTPDLFLQYTLKSAELTNKTSRSNMCLQQKATTDLSAESLKGKHQLG